MLLTVMHLKTVSEQIFTSFRKLFGLQGGKLENKSVT